MKSVPVWFPACLFPATWNLSDSHVNFYHSVSLLLYTQILGKTTAKNAITPLLVDVIQNNVLKASATWFFKVVNVDLSKGFKTADIKDNAWAPRPC